MTARDTYLIALNKLNKLITNNSQDLPEYLWVYNFNEAQSFWISKTYKEVEKDQTAVRKLQKILVPNKKIVDKVNKGNYSEFTLPDNFLNYSSSYTEINKCPFTLENHLFEEHNIKTALKDAMWQPSLQFEETLVTMAGDKLLVYKNDSFEPEALILSYYRKPKEIDIADGFNHTDNTPTKDIDPEFDDMNVYEIIDIAVRQIAANFGIPDVYTTSTNKIKESE